MTEPELTDEQRWERARLLLSQRPDEATVQALDAQRRRALRIVGLILLVAVLLGVGAGIVAGVTLGPRGKQPHVPLWQVITGGVLNFLGAVIIVGCIVWLWRMRRTGVLPARWRSPTLPLSRPQRRSLVRQVAGKEVVEQTTLPLARDLARRTRVQLAPILVMIVGFVVEMCGAALSADLRLLDAVAAFLALYSAVFGILIAWQFRRAGRFLRAHPSD